MRLTRSLALAAATPVLLLGLTACSGDDDSASDEPSGASMPTTAPPAGEQINTREFATLIADAFGKDDTADMRIQIISGGLVTVTTGQVDYSGDTPRMKMTLNSPAMGLEEMAAIVIDQQMYVALPVPDAGDVFYVLDLRDEDNPLVASLGGNAAFDPKASVEVFAEGLKEVVLVGNDSIDGVPVNRYVVTTDTAGLDAFAEDGVEYPETITYDVWLDAEGRLVKMESDLPDGGSMSMTMTNWGGDVDIQAPPAERVQPFPTESMEPEPSPTE